MSPGEDLESLAEDCADLVADAPDRSEPRLSLALFQALLGRHEEAEQTLASGSRRQRLDPPLLWRSLEETRRALEAAARGWDPRREEPPFRRPFVVPGWESRIGRR